MVYLDHMIFPTAEEEISYAEYPKPEQWNRSGTGGGI